MCIMYSYVHEKILQFIAKYLHANYTKTTTTLCITC